MTNPNFTHAIDEFFRTSPDPFRNDFLFDVFNDGRGRTPTAYRDCLDRREINHYGEVIPRIERVRRHLRCLGSIRLDPARLTTLHSHPTYRRPKGKGRRKTDV